MDQNEIINAEDCNQNTIVMLDQEDTSLLLTDYSNTQEQGDGDNNFDNFWFSSQNESGNTNEDKI